MDLRKPFEINDSIFECKLEEGDVFRERTGYWYSLFEEIF